MRAGGQAVEASMSEWQPIETAPKDRAILGWDGKHVNLVRWQVIGESDRGYFACAANGECLDFAEGSSGDDFGVLTHWIPLPKGPR